MRAWHLQQDEKQPCDSPGLTQRDAQCKRMQRNTRRIQSPPTIPTLLHMSQLGMTQWLHYHLLRLLRQYWGGKKRHQSYRYISASGPGSCSCRCLAETCRGAWRMLSQYRTAPRRTGSGCLSQETQIEMKAQISPGKGRRPVKNSEALVLPEVDSVNVFSSHCRRLHFLHKVTENDSWKQFGGSVISICA